MMKRFAFAGRVSTEDQQDPEASRNWQLGRARGLIERHGGHSDARRRFVEWVSEQAQQTRALLLA